MKRRDLFRAAPAAALFALPAMASTDSTIMALFREWQAAMAVANNIQNPCEVSEAACEETQRIETIMARYPAATAQDMAAKIIAWTGDNSLGLDGRGSEVIWEELRALVA